MAAGTTSRPHAGAHAEAKREMKVKLIVAIALLAAGTLALVYEGFSYTTKTHEAKLGPMEFQVEEQERVQVPTWLGVAAIALGGGILVADRVWRAGT